ncbi:MAG: hypothetical protein EPO10_27415 [Reyranella sp.]|uniref:hypothetical protein n=1 Tax=Reyranella sp. TaxID=1929291 RepID=UPI00122B2CFC|nr:hypothetical protein [Reyranella sp.]TAJ97411.1 MAG: hypothetical protein EPO41_03125 [Reyranella sp.]TBR23093.1 MAG: hypothetical protein EPO10_27415 [Reyranella sp.]
MLTYETRKLLRRWAGGEREAVEAEVRNYAWLNERLLIQETLDFLRGFERGEPAARLAEPTYRHRVVLWTILECGSLAAAKHYVSNILGHADTSTGKLPSLVLAAPETPPDQDEMEFKDDPAAEIQIVPRKGSRSVLFVFTGGAKRFSGPLVLMHQWFRRLDASVVYLRDHDGMFYAGGIGSLGTSYDYTIECLSEVARLLGGERILCTGSSAGTFGALLYGLDLSARRVLSLSGPSRLDESAQRVLERQKRRRPSAAPIDPGSLDMAALYGRAHRRPLVRMTFGERNTVDRQEAENMAHLPGVDLDPVPGVEDHDILSSMGRSGFETRLNWLVSG